jgi:hypothetical protein
MARNWSYQEKQKKKRLERSGCGYRFRADKKYWKRKDKNEAKNKRRKIRIQIENFILFLIFLTVIAGLCYIGFKK